MRLLIRGGSIPAGKGVDASYAGILASRFNEHGIEILNRSRSGDSSFEGVWSFNEDINPYRPDVLMVHFGIDDIYRPVYRSEFKENLVGIVKLSRERFSPEIMLLTSHLFGNPVEMDTARVYYRTIFEVASDLRCTYIPVHLWMYSYMNETGMQLEELVQEDVRLPSIEGHKAYAEIVSGKIRSYMKYGAGR